MTVSVAVQGLAETIRAAAARGATLRIRAGGTKDFYGGALQGDVLDVRPVAGVVDYEPTELVVTARAGTPLSELESLLATQNQCLAFEPPAFGAGATVGGVVAAGLAGPRRPFVGSVRDFVLGTQVLDGRGDVLNFGGRVMKNVAGYDVSRLMAGSLGSLGVMLEVSLKVLPRPELESTLVFEVSEDEALDRLGSLVSSPSPLSASAWVEGRLYLRLAGSAAALKRAQAQLGGEAIGPDAAAAHWTALREQTHPWFDRAGALWRVALPPGAARLGGAPAVYEWNGTQRWVALDADDAGRARALELRRKATQAGGHATLFRAARVQKEAICAFTPRAAVAATLESRVKAVLDPHHVFDGTRIGLVRAPQAHANQAR